MKIIVESEAEEKELQEEVWYIKHIFRNNTTPVSPCRLMESIGSECPIIIDPYNAND